MTIAISTDRRRDCTFDCCGAQVRAHYRHLATVVTVRGEIDAVNVDRVSDYIRPFILGQNPVVLDMSGVTHFSPAGLSLLNAVDEDCYTAGVGWTLVAGPAVIELVGAGSNGGEDSEDGTAAFPFTRSVHEALRNVADAIVSRRQLVLPLIKKTA
jgi:anti-anti-sigma factor